MMVKITGKMSSKFYPGFITIYWYMVSGVSAAAGQKNGRSNRKRNPEKENIEYLRNVFYLFFKKKMERSLPSGL